MALKIILIALVVLLTLVVVLPFVLSIAGFNILQFGTAGGGAARRGEAVIMRSQNGGNDWENISNSEDRRTPFPGQVFDLEFHPKEPDTLFLGSRGSGLWKSVNGGVLWKKITDKAAVLDSRADAHKVAVSRSEPKVIYAAVFQDRRGRVLQSRDGGESFQEVYFVTADNFRVFDLAVSPSDPNRVLIATGQGGILETRNGGRTWRVVRWFTEAVEKILPNPQNFSEILALTASGRLFKSVDGGANWADLQPGLLRARSDAQTPLSPIPQPSLNPFAGFTRDMIQAMVPDPNFFPYCT